METKTEKKIDEFMDYSTLLQAITVVEKRCHDACLKKEWPLAACEAQHIGYLAFALNKWLRERQ